MLEGVITDYPDIAQQGSQSPEPEFEDLDGIGSPQFVGDVPMPSIPSTSAYGSFSLFTLDSVSGPEWPEEGAVYVEKTAPAQELGANIQ